jgi:hypothetical protein
MEALWNKVFQIKTILSERGWTRKDGWGQIGLRGGGGGGVRD